MLGNSILDSAYGSTAPDFEVNIIYQSDDTKQRYRTAHEKHQWYLNHNILFFWKISVDRTTAIEVLRCLLQIASYTWSATRCAELPF